MAIMARVVRMYYVLALSIIFLVGLGRAALGNHGNSLKQERSELTYSSSSMYTSVSEQCQEDLNQLLSPNASGNAIRALDAFGKPGSGILVGDWVWLGTYEECQDLQQFHYCLVDLRANVSDVIPPEQRGALPDILPLRWGTCFPESCNKSDVLGGVDQIFDKFLPFSVTPWMAQCSDQLDMWNDGVFVFTVVLCCLLAFLMLYGYGFDIYTRHKSTKFTDAEARAEATENGTVTNSPHPRGNDFHVSTQSAEETPLLKSKQDSAINKQKSLPTRFLLCFALNRNLSKLLDTQQGDRSILCLNGIRVLSLSWVILGHTFVVIIATQNIDNMMSFGPIVKQLGFQAVLNAPFAVDTFFLLSGLLVTMGCINRLERNNGRLPWAWFYFHRYWRLTPTLGFIILITMTQQYFTMGPVWLPMMKRMATKCQDTWWSTMLYINNFYPTRFNDQCAGVTWYLSNDMQFFIISPIFIVLLYKFKKLGLISMACTCLVSFAITAGLIAKYDFDLAAHSAVLVAGPTGTTQLGGSDYNSMVYNKPYCRISVYIVGMVMGLIIQQNRSVRISKSLVISGWLLAAILALLVVYGLYPAISQDSGLTTAGNAFYGALSRCAWGIAVAWVIFACYFGYAGPIDNFLSWRGWVPLSRLTYTAYLIHQIVIYQYYQAHKVTWHLDLVDYCYYFVAIWGFTYAVALIVSLAVEYPFANMEKLVLPSTLESNMGKSKTEDESSKNASNTNV